MDDITRQNVYNLMLTHSNIPKGRQCQLPLLPKSSDIESFHKLQYVKDNIIRFLWRKKNLHIFGPSETGKTTWAINILLQYLVEASEYGVNTNRGVFIHVPTFIQELENEMKTSNFQFNVLKNKIKEADLVIWDDLDCFQISPYFMNKIITLLSYRKLGGKSNIFTTRKPPKLIDSSIIDYVNSEDTIQILLENRE